MNTDIHQFMFEWGPLVTAAICLVSSYIYMRICSTGTPSQLIVAFFMRLFVILGCVMAVVLLESIPGESMSRGELTQQFLLGIPVPWVAGVGLFAWLNPERWTAIAEKRKYERGLK
jgi:hypothetical protein